MKGENDIKALFVEHYALVAGLEIERRKNSSKLIECLPEDIKAKIV